MRASVVYIDGFNLYHGMRDMGWKKYYWLDLNKLSNEILPQGFSLTKTKYFTAPTDSSKDPGGERRQSTYLEALGTLNDLQIYFGKFKSKKVTCKKYHGNLKSSVVTCSNCTGLWWTYEEKMTDVCIATEVLCDAFNGLFDAAFIVSGDSDLVPPIEAIKKHFPDKKITVAFPPARNRSMELKHTAHAYFTIRESALRKSMLPESISLPSGVTLTRPVSWQKNIKPKGAP